MTGLNIEKDKIMEVACLVTDAHLDIVAQHPEIIIHQPPDVLKQMDDWCITNHGKVCILFYEWFNFKVKVN